MELYRLYSFCSKLNVKTSWVIKCFYLCRMKGKQNDQVQCLCKSVLHWVWMQDMVNNRLRALAMSLMIKVITSVSVMKSVELTRLAVDEDHVAWLVTVGYGWSHETLIHHDIRSWQSDFLLGGERKKKRISYSLKNGGVEGSLRGRHALIALVR